MPTQNRRKSTRGSTGRSARSTGARSRSAASRKGNGIALTAKRAASKVRRSVSARAGSARRSAGAERAAATRRSKGAARGATSRRSATSRGSASMPRALALLSRDHRNVERLFREFEDAGGQHRVDIARTICTELTIHATLEEELFYPALAQAARNGQRSDVGEALVEHSVVKGLITKLQGMGNDDNWYEETVTVLKELVEHHVEEEESILFRDARRSGVNLDDLGLWMMQRKAQLRTEHGLPEVEDLRMDVRESARLRELEEAGPASRFLSRIGAMASAVSH